MNLYLGCIFVALFLEFDMRPKRDYFKGSLNSKIGRVLVSLFWPIFVFLMVVEIIKRTAGVRQ